MREKIFFSIPVYRLAEDKYYKDQQAYVDKIMFPGPHRYDEDRRIFNEKYPEQKQNFEQHIINNYGGAWSYNKVIGWIELHFLSSQIRGEYWRVNVKRIARSRKKVFECVTWKLAAEIDIREESKNKEILSLIYEYLSDCKKELKGRYIDTSIFDNIGKHVDWRSLLSADENV